MVRIDGIEEFAHIINYLVILLHRLILTYVYASNQELNIGAWLPWAESKSFRIFLHYGISAAPIIIFFC